MPRSISGAFDAGEDGVSPRDFSLRQFELVEMTGIEPDSKYWIFNISENPADTFANPAIGPGLI